MHYCLIDYENVQPNIDSYAINPMVDLTVFVGLTQCLSNYYTLTLNSMGDRARVIKINVNGNNSLDMHLVYHLSIIVNLHKCESFEIISNDQDYDALLSTLRADGINVYRTKCSDCCLKKERSKRHRELLKEHAEQRIIKYISLPEERRNILEQYLLHLSTKTGARPKNKLELKNHMGLFIKSKAMDRIASNHLAEDIVDFGHLRISKSSKRVIYFSLNPYLSKFTKELVKTVSTTYKKI